MADGTVLVMPSAAGMTPTLRRFLDDVVGAQLVIAEAGDGQLAARACAAITSLQPLPPITVVTFDEAALLLPAIAVAQRAAHRRVVGYVLVDPVLPPVTESWPDAPVTVVTDDTDGQASLQSRLRGWVVLDHAAFAHWRPDDD